MRVRVLASLIFLLLCISCGQGQTAIRPPEIHYGEDVCDECGMIISDPRFASGFLHEVAQGRVESLIFDDIGNMLVYMEKHPGQHIVAWYVHDYTSEEWLDATQAYFVSSQAIQTPMDHGITAYGSQQAALAMAAERGGEVLDWTALQASHDHHSHAQIKDP
jgi:copper chaperone NosL